MKKETEEKTKIKHFKCFRCNKLIHIPEDYKGNPYHLLEVHYAKEHDINLQKDGWLKTEESSSTL